MSTEPSASIKASDGGSTSTWSSAKTSGRCSSRRVHSQCSIQFGKGRTTADPGSAQGLILVVADIDAARDDLDQPRRRGQRGQVQRPPGLEAAGRSYFAQASFSDPDGNGWVLQEVTTRLPGRAWDD